MQNPSVERVFFKFSDLRMPGLATEPPPWYEQGYQTTTYRGDGSMTLHQSIADTWKRSQDELFPSLREQVGHLGKRHQRFVAILDLVPVEGFLPGRWRGTGRRPQDRRAIARAFIAKAVWNLPTTRDLLDQLQCDRALRRLCGWHHPGEIPSEATFSRAFAEFAGDGLPERLLGSLRNADWP